VTISNLPWEDKNWRQNCVEAFEIWKASSVVDITQVGYTMRLVHSDRGGKGISWCRNTNGTNIVAAGDSIGLMPFVGVDSLSDEKFVR
jgi:hypothetical protein